MKSKKYVLLFIILLLPILMGALNVEVQTSTSEIVAIVVMEAFVTIHSTFFFLKPLASLICPYNISEKKFFWILFIIRIVILLIFDILGMYWIAAVDIVCVFSGFILIPLSTLAGNKIKKARVDRHIAKEDMYMQMQMFCKKCGTKLDPSLKKCSNCGAPSHIYKGN